jgi:hypothetical protein
MNETGSTNTESNHNSDEKAREHHSQALKTFLKTLRESRNSAMVSRIIDEHSKKTDT